MSDYNVNNLEKIFGYDYMGINNKLITNPEKQFIEIVEGKHDYIYLYSLNNIVEKTKDFIDTLK